ncbi:anaerobic ribonucleoside-triphosphate reductase [Candidatus Stoquefichus massiliensis]|uniref:anaerobic ribonucleoside-triphosphate reductase n=1 Tax=Candidatus Stoquefichus massiliensis TaxID=1470350 RepID=UPI000487F4DC|nr:anaerobic ribonucleoside-triphosphate reductase [Candidatus Stoquefichus massiliensis]
MKKTENVNVEIINGAMDEEEIRAYIHYVKEKYKDETLLSLTLTIDGDYVDMHYHLKPQPIERIRRITGYLVGTLDRFNDAKKAEEHDRVKHHI